MHGLTVLYSLLGFNRKSELLLKTKGLFPNNVLIVLHCAYTYVLSSSSFDTFFPIQQAGCCVVVVVTDAVSQYLGEFQRDTDILGRLPDGPKTRKVKTDPRKSPQLYM